MMSCRIFVLQWLTKKTHKPVHDALLASTACEELHVVRNVDNMHQFAFIREKKATKQKT